MTDAGSPMADHGAAPEPEFVPRPEVPTEPEFAPHAEFTPETEQEVSLRALALLAAAGAVLGWAMVGLDGAVLAPAVVLAGWTWRREPGRPIAAVAVILLSIAAVATVLEVTPRLDDIGLSFPRRRPVAGRTAAMAGVLLGVSLLVFAYTERARRAAPFRALSSLRWEVDPRGWADAVPGLVRRVAPWVALGLGATAVRLIAAPARIPEAMAGVVANLRFGTIYGQGAIWDGPTTDVPPLATAVLAYGPLAPRLAVTAASVAAAVVACRLAHQHLGRRGALATGVVAALLPSMWDQPLPMALAALATAGAVALGDPEHLDGRRAALAGAAAGLAMLAAPDAIVVLPVLVAWQILTGSRSQRHLVATLIAAGIAVMSPWLAYVAGVTGVPVPAGSWSGWVLDGLAVPSLPTVASLVLGAVVVGLVARELLAVRDAWAQLLPYVVLPAWCVVLGVVSAGERDLLGWSAPLVAVVLGSALCRWYEHTNRVETDPAEDGHLFA